MIRALHRIVTRAKAKARAERDAAVSALKAAQRRNDTRAQHEAAERARRATERCLRLGV